MSKMKIIIAILTYFLIINSIYSQINTDRPGYTDPPQTIGLGKFQWENGLDFTYYNNINNYEFNLINSLFRYGLTDYSEIRFFLAYSNIQSNEDKITISGLSEIGIGLKLKIYESNFSLIPSNSLIIGLGLPNGDNNFKRNIIEPSLIFVFENSINDNLSIGYNVGFNWTEESISYLYSFSLGYNLLEDINLTIGYMSELYRYDKPIQYLEFAIGYIITNNFQVDFWTSFTPFFEVKENYLSIGFSWLLF